jgi:hypothetical protein
MPMQGSSVRTYELRSLALADRHIAEAERRVAEQMVFIEHLKANGDDTGLSEVVLTSLETALAEWRTQRERIIQSVGQPGSSVKHRTFDH